jgi:hypothetical protein
MVWGSGSSLPLTRPCGEMVMAIWVGGDSFMATCSSSELRGGIWCTNRMRGAHGCALGRIIM